jgi:hypothetical protein
MTPVGRWHYAGNTVCRSSIGARDVSQRAGANITVVDGTGKFANHIDYIGAEESL